MARKSKIDIPSTVIRNGIIALLAVILALWMYRSVAYALRNSSAFIITNVTSGADVQFLQDKVLRQLKGHNIFAVDLKALHKQIRSLYPQIYDLRVERRFPNTIHIEASKRDAFAQIVWNNNYLIIDDDGVVIFSDKKSVDGVPLIKNAGLPGRKIFLGSRVSSAGVFAAIEVIKTFKNNSDLVKYPISDFDVENVSKISFYIGPQLQIFIDKDDVEKKLEMLALLIAQKKLDFREVKYIDLRFKEPVVGKK